jgi:uncharacterized membrane protein
MRYAKSIAAAVGLLALLSKEVLGIEIGSETVDQVSNGIIALITWASIYLVPNTGE